MSRSGVWAVAGFDGVALLGGRIDLKGDVMRMHPGKSGRRVEAEQVSLQEASDHFVRDDQWPFCWFLAHLIKGSGRSNIGVGVAFAAGEPPLPLVGSSALPLAGKLRVDLLVDQAAELTVVEFGQLVDDLDLTAECFADDACRRDRSSERADEDAVDSTSLQGRRMAVRLRDTVGRQRRVEPALPASLQVPLRLTVPSQKHRVP